METVTHPDHEHRSIDVLINKREVKFRFNPRTGLQIKETAIAEGVKNVSLDFDLLRIVGDTQHRVADDEEVHLRPSERFVIVRPDHSS